MAEQLTSGTIVQKLANGDLLFIFPNTKATLVEENAERQFVANVDKTKWNDAHRTAMELEASIGLEGGYAPLNAERKIPVQYLPSYIDSIQEYNNLESFPMIGMSGVIYIALDTHLTYRWGGTTYSKIGQDVALGTTSGTAYPGNLGADLSDKINKMITDGTTAIVLRADVSNKTVKFETTKTISISGDVVGNTSTDFGTNPTINVSLNNTGVTAGTYSTITTDAKGRITAGAQIIEVGALGQTTPSSNLAVGGIFIRRT